MAVSDNQKLDYLWKKIGYGVSKTDTNNNKAAPNEWFFDYQSGLLHFIGTNLPGISFGGKSIYVSGARYTGTFGVGAADGATLRDITLAGNTTISNLVLSSVLGTQYGGTGLSSFTENGVMIASNTSVLGFATGTTGEVLQVGSDGSPTFDSLDGGNF